MTATAPLVTIDRPRDGVAVITLNRPDKLNALSFDLVDELHGVLDEIADWSNAAGLASLDSTTPPA